MKTNPKRQRAADHKRRARKTKAANVKRCSTQKGDSYQRVPGLEATVPNRKKQKLPKVIFSVDESLPDGVMEMDTIDDNGKLCRTIYTYAKSAATPPTNI